MQRMIRFQLAIAFLTLGAFASSASAIMVPPPPLPPTLLDEEHPSLPAFSPAELWNIDSKVDDGAPGTGQVVIYGTSSDTAISGCTDGGDSSATSARAAKYLNTVDAKACASVFRNQF